MMIKFCDCLSFNLIERIVVVLINSEVKNLDKNLILRNFKLK